MPKTSPKLIFAFILLVLVSLRMVAFASEPVLRNKLHPGLRDFKKTVERQAREFPDFFFLSRPDIEEPKIALTFDDGPDDQFTPKILDILKEKGVKATFFLLGERVNQFPEVTRRIHEEGHQIGNHSWSHPDFRELENEKILAEEIKPTEKAIQQITGENPLYIRPPYGAIKDEAIKELGEKGYKIVNWSVDSFDWDSNKNQPQKIFQRILTYIHPGDILLFHSAGGNRENTVEALREIIIYLENKGFLFTTVQDLIK